MACAASKEKRAKNFDEPSLEIFFVIEHLKLFSSGARLRAMKKFKVNCDAGIVQW